MLINIYSYTLTNVMFFLSTQSVITAAPHICCAVRVACGCVLRIMLACSLVERKEGWKCNVWEEYPGICRAKEAAFQRYYIVLCNVWQEYPGICHGHRHTFICLHTQLGWSIASWSCVSVSWSGWAWRVLLLWMCVRARVCRRQKAKGMNSIS